MRADSGDRHNAASTLGRWSIFVLFLLGFVLSYFFRSANAIIATDLASELSLDAAQLGSMTSIFFLAFALVQLPLGSALDRYGPRWVTSLLMLFAAAGCLVFATAQSYWALATGRALIGLGMAGILMGALKAFSAWFSPVRFATMSSLLVGMGSLGALLAATPLAWLNEQVGWRSVFAWGSLAIVFSAAAIASWSRNAPPGVAWRKAAHAGNTLLHIFSDHRLWRIALLNFYAVGTTLSVQGLWGASYARDVFGLSAITTGNLLVMLAIGVTAGNLMHGWLADTFGRARSVIAAATVFTCCQLVFALTIVPLPGLALSTLYLMFGLTGAFGVVLFSHARSIFPVSMVGQAITAVNLFGIGGAMLIQWSMGLIIAGFGASTGPAYPPEAYRGAFLLTTAIGAGTLLGYLPIAAATSTGSASKADAP